MNGAQVLARRMASLRLSGEPLDSPQQVVAHLAAVQAQDYAGAKWAVGQRMAAGTDAGLDEAYNSGAILRTHVLRPTWHFVTPADIRWLLELTRPRVQVRNAPYYSRRGLDAATLSRSANVIADALRGGRSLTRDGLRTVLHDAGIDTTDIRMAYLLMNAELEEVICSGGLVGKQHTYALLDERIPVTPPKPREDALAELTLRYFASHGPATERDFRSWSSLTASDVRAGLSAARELLRQDTVDGVRYWSGTQERTAKAPTILLVQGYDEYIMGYTESKPLLDVAGHAKGLTQRTIYNHTVFLDGQLIGHWKRTLTRSTALVDVVLYAPLTARQNAALQKAAQAHSDFLGLPVRVETRLT